MLPSGLASISSRLDDTPNVRGAVDMAQKVRRRAAMEELIALDADMIGQVTQAEVLEAAARARKDLGSAIDRHAQLAVSAGYRSTDRR